MPSSMPFIKICGLTRPEDVLLCHSLGVAYTGHIFVPKSPRCITVQQAATLPSGPSARVGVFAGQDAATITRIARAARLDFIQLHGGEDAAVCKRIGPERVIKTLWPDAHTPQSFTEVLERFAPVCAFFLFDSGASGGGSGNTVRPLPIPSGHIPRPWLLAGGIGPETLPEAIAVSPSGLDMNSALETAPGVKDHARLRLAVQIVQKG